MLLSLRTSLNKGSFTIKRDPHVEQPTELASLVFDSVTLGSVLYVESWKASASLGDLRLYDGVTENTRYHQLVGVSRKHLLNNGGDGDDGAVVAHQPFFSVEYEYRPLGKQADNAITLVMRNIDIVYNPIIIREILTFFRPPTTSIDSVNALVEVAGDTLEDIKKQTRSTLTFALEQHTTLDLHVDMDAPIIVIPERYKEVDTTLPFKVDSPIFNLSWFSCTSQTSRGIVLDAGHINIESQLVSPETVAAMKSKRAADYTTDDHQQLRSLMYDRFTMKLTQTKILVGGDSVDACLLQIRDPKPSLDYLHLVDRIDMTFLLELCILEASPELAKFKMSGHLPLLRVNFSDSKYRTIMQLPQLISASGLFGQKDDDDEDEEEGQNNVNTEVRGDAAEKLTADDIKRRSLMDLKLWKQAEDVLFVDMDSEHGNSFHTTDDEDEGPSVMTKASSVTTLSGTSRDKKAKLMDQKQFELDFRVDKVLANIYQATPVSEHAQVPEKLLSVLSLQGLSLDYMMRPYDMSVDLTLQAMDVIDRMTHGNEFKYLVTSNHEVLEMDMPHGNSSNNGGAGRHDEVLVKLHYIQTDKKSPEYLAKYKGIDRTVHLTLSTLNFIVTRSSVLTLYNYAMSTFVDPEQQAPSSRRKSSSAAAAVAAQPPTETQNVRVDLFLDSVNFILNNDGTRIATGELSHGDLLILLVEGKTKVQSKFANFTLTDDSKSHGNGDPHHQPQQLLTIQGDELIDLRYETFLESSTIDGPTATSYPGYDQSLYLRMGSAQFTFLENPVCELLSFLSKFAAMKTFYDRARQAALETAQQQYNTMTKMHFDVVIRTPVVLFPEQQLHGKDVVVAHLGEIWASNAFVVPPQDEGCALLNCVKAGLRAMNLTSKWHFATGTPEQVQLQTLPIIDDIDLNLDIVIPHTEEGGNPGMAGATKRPGLDITGDLSRVSMNLTERQYKFLLDATQMISRVFGQLQQEEPASDGFMETKTDRRTSHLLAVSDKALPASSSSFSTADATDGTSAPLRFRMALQMPTIEFEVYTDSKVSNASPPVSLSRFALNGSSLQVCGQENGSIEVGWQVHTLTVDDTRPDIQSKFRHIVPAMQHGHQFLMQCDLSPPSDMGGGRHGIVLLTINEPKMIVSLDHVFMLYQFFTTPTSHPAKSSVSPPPLPQRPSHHRPSTTANDKKAAQQEEEESGSLLELSYRLNVTNVEFILLADPDAVDSEAVVLSTEKIMISHQSVMALAVKKMGMFLCRMDSRDTSTLRFIQPFDISISMNNNDLSEGEGGVIELEVDVDALVLRLSYRDAMLVTSIFNKAYDLYNKYIMSTTVPVSPGISYAQNLLDQATTSALQFATQTKESVIRIQIHR